MSLKQEFLDWKRHPITIRVMAGLKEQEETMIERLVETAGMDPTEDAKARGYILALRDVYLVEIHEDEGDNSNA